MKLKDIPLAADVRVAEKEVEKCIIVTGNFYDTRIEWADSSTMALW